MGARLNVFTRIILPIFLIISILPLLSASTRNGGSQLTGLDIVLVIDRSGSMGQTDALDLQGNIVSRLDAAKQAALAFVNYLGSNDRVGVVSFSSYNDHRVDHKLTDPIVDADDHINALPVSNMTGIGNGILDAKNLLDNQKASDHLGVIVVMTDGEENEGTNPLQKAKDAVDACYYVYCLGFGTNPDMNLLQQMADYSKTQKGLGKAFQATTAQDIKNIYAETRGQILNIPVITVNRTVTKAAGTNRYDVTLTVDNLGGVTAHNLVVREYLNDLQFVAACFRFPLDGSWDVEQDFNKYNSKFGGYHLGEDVLRDSEVPVYAPADGIVKHNTQRTDYGYVVIIEHKVPKGAHACSVLGHLKAEGLASVGSKVNKGQIVGYLSGDSNENGGYDFIHLHFGIRKGSYSTTWVYWGYGSSSEVNNWYGACGLRQIS